MYTVPDLPTERKKQLQATQQHTQRPYSPMARVITLLAEYGRQVLAEREQAEAQDGELR